MLTMRVIVTVRAQLESMLRSPLVTWDEEGSRNSRGDSSSDEITHSLQPLRDTIHAILIPISVLVIRKRIERVLALVIFGRISPTSVNA